MANTLQTDLKKKTQDGLLYVPAQTGQKGTGSLVINSSANQPAYGFPVSNQKTTVEQKQSMAAQASPEAQASPAGPNINGVSDWSRQGLAQYGQQYAPSQAVTEAQNYLQSVMGGQPGGFSSRYAGDIAALYDQIMNRPKFEYDVNRDPLFQQYKNQYTVQGQRAMQDTMGQAAGLTGGYGNSWGTTAGYQAYQYYLQQLNDRIPEMEQRAFDRYTAEGDEMRANMNMATTLDNIDYGRYRDTVADWQADRAFAANLYANERNWDMSEWNSLRSYYTQLAGMENSDYWAGENLKENARQFDADLAYRYYGTDLDEAFRRDSMAENARQFDADLAYRYYGADKDDAYRYAQLAENARQYDTSFAENQRQYNTDAAYRQAEADRAADQWLKQYEESIRQYNQNFGEDQRQFDVNAAYRQAEADRAAAQWQSQFNENVRQADLDEAYRQAQMAESIRQYNQNFGETVRQNDLDEAYRRDTLAENVRQADLDEAYRQAQMAESIRQYNQNFGEDQRQYDTSLAEKVREFDLGYGLDQAEFDLKYRQYMDALAQLEGGGSESGGNGGSNSTANTAPEAAASAASKDLPSMQELMVNYAQNKVGTNDNALTETLKKDLESQKGDMVTLPIAKVNANGTLNQGPLAERTPAMPREQAEELIKEMEELKKKSKTTTAKTSTAKTSLATAVRFRP